MSAGIADFVDGGSSDDQDDDGQTDVSQFGIGDAESSPSPSDEHLDLKVMSVDYTDSEHGTVVHVFGRDADGNRHHVEVEGHSPSFYIREEAYTDRLDNHYAVDETEAYDEDGERYTDLYGNPLVRVYTYTPGQVSEVRDLFDWTGEADVFYRKRWMIDEDIYTGIRIDTSDATTDEGWLRGEMRVDNAAVAPLDLDDTPDVDPRLLVLDIEVGSGVTPTSRDSERVGDSEVGGEDGVPDADRAEYPVTSIVAWDSDAERYVGWLLIPPSADADVKEQLRSTSLEKPTELDDARVFDDESQLLHDFNEWVSSRRPDIISGWYSNDFDLPYLVNRCRNLNTYNYQDWSPLGDVYLTRFDPVISGVAAVDMLEGYKKTQIHKLKQKGLDDIAERELDEGKVALSDDDGDLSHTEMWRERPVEFLRYNKVDVELVHRIDESRGVIDLLDNLRAVTGCSYTDPIGGNIDMMDIVFLRKAQEYGHVLPTAEAPEVGDYHGAYVYQPESGLHENVVYPDYSSLYPNMMYQCNISPETLIGTADDLAASEYDEDDCVWTYVDDETPPDLKEDVEASEERMEKLYFLDPDEKEGFVRSVLDDIMGMCDRYTGDMYAATKRVRNSTYGVLGDSDSYSVGFRLFDWRLAEGTTLGGQRVLKEGGRKFTVFVDDPDARVIYGDSVPADEPITTRDGIVSADNVSEGDEVWTDDGWSEVNSVIEKPATKQLYTVRTKRGVTHVTEDHGLLRPDGTEVTPEEISVGDELLHREPPLDHGESDVSRAEAWAWGVFAAEGSCQTYDTKWGTKHSWAISNQDENLLRCLQSVLPFETNISAANENDDTHKLQLSGNGHHGNAIGPDVVAEWRDRHYDDRGRKVVPSEILSAEEGVKMAFLSGFHVGDGHMRDYVERTDFDELWSKSSPLAHGLDMLLTSLGYETTLSYRRNHGEEYYRVRVVEWHKGSTTEVTAVEPYDYDGATVYDFETENHHFHAGIGDIIVHNTDSVVTTFPNADGPEDTLDQAMSAADDLNEYLDEFAAEQFGLSSPDEARMEIEIESYARAIFFKGKDDGLSDEGVKKRYVQAEEWNDDDGWLDEPDIDITGFEYVRSDVADVTADVQYYCFAEMMKHGTDAEADIREHVTDVITRVMEGDYPLGDVGIPFGISKDVESYGSTVRRPQPAYRGAKFANREIYGGDAIEQGDKPLKFYIEEGKTGEDIRATYDSPTAEDGDYVDAVSVLDADDLPEGCRVDRGKMVEKTIIDPMTPIFRTLGWGVSWMRDAVEDAKPPEAYRDEGQTGFEQFEEPAANFM